MKRISQRLPGLYLAIAVAAILWSPPRNAQAIGYGFGFGFSVNPAFRHASPYGHGYAPSYPETYHYWNSYYPKYYTQFHARNYQNLGVSPGDIGIRGNGIMWTPW